MSSFRLPYTGLFLSCLLEPKELYSKWAKSDPKIVLYFTHRNGPIFGSKTDLFDLHFPSSGPGRETIRAMSKMRAHAFIRFEPSNKGFVIPLLRNFLVFETHPALFENPTNRIRRMPTDENKIRPYSAIRVHILLVLLTE